MSTKLLDIAGDMYWTKLYWIQFNLIKTSRIIAFCVVLRLHIETLRPEFFGLSFLLVFSILETYCLPFFLPVYLEKVTPLFF